MVEQSTYADLLYNLRELRRDYPNFKKVNRLFSVVQHALLGHLLEEQQSDGLDGLEDQIGIDTTTGLDYISLAPLLLDAGHELEVVERYSWLRRLLKPFEHEFVQCGTETDCRLFRLLAKATNNLGSITELKILLERARPWIGVKADKVTECEFTNHLSYCLKTEGRFIEAAEGFAHTISLAEKAGYIKGLAFANFNLADTYVAQGLHSKAIELLLIALGKYEAIGSLEGQSRTHARLSENYGAIADYDLAEFSAKRAIHLAEQSGNILSLRIAYMSLVIHTLNRGDFAQSVEVAKRALALESTDFSVIGQADLLRLLGDCYIYLGLYSEALTSLDHAHDLFASAGIKLGVIGSLRSKAHVAALIGEGDWAIDTLNRVLNEENIHGLSSSRELVKARLFRAQMLADTGQLEASLLDLAEARRVVQSLNNELLLADSYLAEGGTYSKAAYWDEALTAYKNSLNLLHGLDAEYPIIGCSLSIANIYLNQNYQGMSLVEAMPFVEPVRQAFESGQMRDPSVALRAQSMFERVAVLSEDWQRAFELVEIQVNQIRHSDSPQAKTNLQRSIVRRNREQRETERAQKEAAQRELIAVMLPETISEELLAGKRYVANTYPAVSLLLLDVVGFTDFSTKATNTEIISLLNRFFSGIDAICRDTGVEKIKTIGDAYLACCGAPYPDVEHAKKIARCANAILEFVERFNADSAMAGLLSFFSNGLQVRIGLHSGSVIGGVVGLDRYQFDLWGDAVDRVKEVESAASPNAVLYSPEFEQALREADGSVENGVAEI